MHQTGFAHRDLKPENCVLEERTHVLKVGGVASCYVLLFDM
jgi:serine/threonine protein kinase